MPTNWTKTAGVSNSTWAKNPNIQSDYGAMLDENDNRITDNAGNVILVHTGIFYDKNTEWTKTPSV